MTNVTTTALAHAVQANAEETELESLVEVLGNESAQDAAHAHTLPELVAAEQGHGMDHRLSANLDRRAA